MRPQSATTGNPPVRQILLVFASVLLLLAAKSHAAGPGSEFEVLQMKATVAYNDGKYPEAAESLHQILEKRPNDLPALELMALCQQNLDKKAAEATYVRLIALGQPEKVAAYHFQLATLLFGRKGRGAREHFQKAVDGQFNTGLGHFFLGLIAMSGKDWKTARTHLEAAREGEDAAAVRPRIDLALGQTYTELGLSRDSMRSYYDAARPPESVDTINGGIRQSALKELKKLDHLGFYGSLSLISQWDTNVQSNPTDVHNPTPQTFQRSMKEVVSASVGGATSPVRAVQVLPVLRLFTNYDFNQYTRNFDFVSISPSLTTMFDPWERLTFGVKGEFTYSLKNTLDVLSPSATTTYEGFSLTGDVGPLARLSVTPDLTLAAEVTWRPKKFYQDAIDLNTRRTGQGYYARVSGEYLQTPLFNPSAYVAFEQDFPAGGDYRFRALSVGASNAIHATGKLTVSPGVDFSATSYYETAPIERVDNFISFRAMAQYRLAAHWSLLADGALMSNSSTQPTKFSFNRTLVSGGATYSF